MSVLAALYILYFATEGEHLGPEDSWWNSLRRQTLPHLHDALNSVDDSLYAVNRSYVSEYAVTLRGDYEDVAQWLSDMGYDRSPLAGLKYRIDEWDDRDEYDKITDFISDHGDYELSSWAQREAAHPYLPDPLAFWQTHVFLFENEDGTFDVYAHWEYSSMNPIVAIQHYRGLHMDHYRGVENILADMEQRPHPDVERVTPVPAA